MTAIRRRLAVAVLAAGLLAGCAISPVPVDPDAESPYCQKTSKGRIITCTAASAPSPNTDAQAKLFVPDPNALTVYVVRRNWGDSRNVIKVRTNDGLAVETLPNTMARIKLAPGTHAISFELDGKTTSRSVTGKAGEVRFLRIDGTAWAWGSSYVWANEPDDVIRARALKTRLVADVPRR